MVNGGARAAIGIYAVILSLAQRCCGLSNTFDIVSIGATEIRELDAPPLTSVAGFHGDSGAKRRNSKSRPGSNTRQKGHGKSNRAPLTVVQGAETC